MIRPRKWIRPPSESERLIDVALRSIEERVSAVGRHLDLAARKPFEDPEHVHQLRVWSRRATTAVRIYQDLLPRRRARWMLRQLKRIRRAAGRARDLDVLGERLSASEGLAARLADRVHKKRRRAQRPIMAIHRRLMIDDRLTRRLARLVRKAQREGPAGEREPSSAAWAARRLKPVLQRFDELAQSPLADEESLHRFRIRCKQLRYVMELLAWAFPPAFRQELHPVVMSLQEKLGELNDHTIILDRFLRWQRRNTDPELATPLAALIESEQARVDWSRAAFFEWWTSQKEASLRAGFRQCLGES